MMTGPNLISLIALGVLFLVWVVLMFRMLWTLYRRSRGKLKQTGGGYFRWAGHSIGTYRDFFTSAEDRPERRRIYLATAFLFAVIVARAFLLTPPA
jgi:amino acid transporter